MSSNIPNSGTDRWSVRLGIYALWIALTNLVWELLQLPLYTIWQERDLAHNVFAAVHCTGGDVLIALSSLLIALGIVGNGRWPAERFVSVLILATLLGVSYTVFSEWLNTSIRMQWAYSSSMPVIPGLGTGLAPILQWLILPPLGLCVCRRLIAMRAR